MVECPFRPICDLVQKGRRGEDRVSPLALDGPGETYTVKHSEAIAVWWSDPEFRLALFERSHYDLPRNDPSAVLLRWRRAAKPVLEPRRVDTRVTFGVQAAVVQRRAEVAGLSVWDFATQSRPW